MFPFRYQLLPTLTNLAFLLYPDPLCSSTVFHKAFNPSLLSANLPSARVRHLQHRDYYLCRCKRPSFRLYRGLSVHSCYIDLGQITER